MDGPSPEMFPQVPKSFFDALDAAKMPPGPIREAAGEPTRPLIVSKVKCPPRTSEHDLSSCDPRKVLGDPIQHIYTTHDGRAFSTQAEAHAHLMSLRIEEENRRKQPLSRSLDDEIMDIEVAKIDRYAKFVQPALNTILPGLDRVERSSRDVDARVESLEKKFTDFDKDWRRNFAYIILANVAAIIFFYISFRHALH